MAPPEDAWRPAPDAPEAEKIALREILTAALLTAAPIALELFRPGAPSPARSWRKGDGSSVTEADLAVNAALEAALRAASPDAGWLSEEEPESDNGAARVDLERVFIVDPIDGTRSFMEGSDAFCLSAALVERGRPLAAAVYAPARGALYDAALGLGARKDGAPLPRQRPAPPDPPTVLAPARDLEGKRWRRGAPPARRAYLQPIAHRLCLVAAGEADGLIALKSTKEWDVAAADLIARESGLTVTDRRGAPLLYNKPDPSIGGVLAAPAALHEAWLAREPG